MSEIHVTNYKSNKLLELKRRFVLNTLFPTPELLITNNNSVDVIVKYKQQKIALVIDMTSSIYSYHSGLKNIIYYLIPRTLHQLIKGLYEIGLNIEISVLCTRMTQAPLQVLVQSYMIEQEEDYHDLTDLIKNKLEDLYFSERLEEDERTNIKFNTVLK